MGGAALLGASAWNAASLILPQLYVLAMSVVAARFLTPADMGRQSYIAFIALSLAMLMTGGLPSGFQRFGADTLGRGRPEHFPYLLRWAWRLEIGAAAVAGGVMVAAAALGSEPRAAWVLAGGFCVAAILRAIPAAALAVLQRWREISILGIVLGAVSTAGVAAVLAGGGGITGMFAVELAGAAIGLAVTLWLLRSALAELRVEPVKSVELRRRATRWAVVASFTGILAFVVWRRSEFLFLNEFSSDEQIAMYSIAFAGTTAVAKLPEAVGMVVSPFFATLSGAREMDRIRSGYARAIRLLLLVSVPLTALTLSVGPATIRLVYGSAYEDAASLVAILAPTLPLLALVSVSRGVVFGVGRQRSLVVVGVFAAVVNITLDVVLIQLYDATGAAIANAGAQGAAAIAYVAIARRLAGGGGWAPAALARNVLAASAAGAGAWAATAALPGVPGVLAGIAIFAVAFCLLAVMLRIMPSADGPWLDAMVAARLRGRLETVTRRMIGAASRA
ncbi:MAG TPA: polysaccharide biosynthesis C-terminal domain-containing protein [Thermoleophilaceae bacterium]